MNLLTKIHNLDEERLEAPIDGLRHKSKLSNAILRELDDLLKKTYECPRWQTYVNGNSNQLKIKGK